MPITDTISPAAVQEQVNASTRDVLAFVESNKIAVTDLSSLAAANAVRKAIGDRQRAIIAQLAKPKNWAHGLHAWFCSLEKAALAPLQILDTYEREQISAFNVAEQQRRQERERDLAEQRRRQIEAHATAEAAALEAAGESELADAVMAEAINATPPTVVLPDAVKAVQSFRRTWHFEVVDVAEVPRDFLMVDEAKLRRYATAMKDSAKVPGVKFFYRDDPVR